MCRHDDMMRRAIDRRTIARHLTSLDLHKPPAATARVDHDENGNLI